MPDRHHSIAILPFENFSGTVADARLAGGFVQDLIAELARFPSVGVIAAESIFAAHATALDDAALSRKLKVPYFLKGSIRRSARALRIAVQLVEVESGRHLWAERYDIPAEELFAVQDAVVAKVANALTLRIDQTVLHAARRRQITSLAAYECWLRGMECLQRGTVESDDEARSYFEQALRVDPQFARAQAGLSLSHFNEWSCQAWGCWQETQDAAYECAVRAERLDPDDPLVQMILAKIAQYRRQHEVAETRYQRARQLAPNDAFICIQLSAGFALLGDARLGSELGERALELNPLCPPWWFYYAAMPYFVQRNYRRALELGVRTPCIVTDGPAYLAAAHAFLGEHEQAKSRAGEFREVFLKRITGGREADPDEGFRWLLHVNPYRRDEDRQHFTEGLHLAGLAPPETSAPKAAAAATIPWPLSNTFRKEGDLWMICFEHEVVHVPGVRGFEDIAQLLAHPSGEMHCTALAGPAAPGVGAPVLDEQARRTYRARLRDIENELAQAEANNDPQRIEKLAEEKEQLLDEMRKATGLGGRDRKMSDDAERARSAVTSRIRHAIKKLEPAHPRLARHFSNSIKTGVFCSYQPEKETRWLV